MKKKSIFYFPKYYRLTLFPSRGARIGHPGGFSCAAHLLINLRSPNFVTFPNVILLILRLFM